MGQAAQKQAVAALMIGESDDGGAQKWALSHATRAPQLPN